MVGQWQHKTLLSRLAQVTLERESDVVRTLNSQLAQKESISQYRKGQHLLDSGFPGAGASSCPLEETGSGCRPTVRFFREEAKQLFPVGLPPCHKLGAVILERLS